MNIKMLSALSRLSDDVLLSRVKHLAAVEREATVALIAHLTELDARRLYLGEGYPSLFAYCTHVLRLSEHATYGRIEATRAARRFPIILELLENGSITLTTVCLLGPHLTKENHRAVLESARHLSKRQVEELVARLHPKPPVPSSVRLLPRRDEVRPSPEGPRPVGATLEESATDRAGEALQDTLPEAACPCDRPQTSKPTSVIAPLAPERYRVQFTASAGIYEKFRRAQALLRHQIPDGDPAAVLDRALTVLLDHLEKQKLAATDRPRLDPPARQPPGRLAHSRHIPSAVKRAVWQRDDGRCAYVSAGGHRCPEQGFLEFHHVMPHSLGGRASIENIQLRCRAHNGYEADVAFGGLRGQVREVAAGWELGPDRVRESLLGRDGARGRGRTHRNARGLGHSPPPCGRP